MLFRSSFKVLLKEMQSLALDVHVQSDDGREVEVREEDDELLRAAEELGIDLSPAAVRVAAAEVAAEGLEAGGSTLVEIEGDAPEVSPELVDDVEDGDEDDDAADEVLPVIDLDEEVVDLELDD